MNVIRKISLRKILHKNRDFYLKRDFLNNFSSVNSTHVDLKDDLQFSKINDWWNRANGSMRVLHYFNDLRMSYINSVLEKNNEKLSNLKILDVGCGAGILCEVKMINEYYLVLSSKK